MKALILLAALVVPVLASVAHNAHAGELFEPVDPAPRDAVWVDSGFATYHFRRDKNLNGANPGLGLEYQLRGDLALTAGRFYNSDRAHSNYLGTIWQPYAAGRLRVGAVIAAFNGYPGMRGGGWFPALVPAASVEYRRVGVNVAVVPGYRDRLYGGISVQVKLKVFE